MMSRIPIFTLLMAAAMTGVSHAATFSANGGGATGTSSTIGSGGDYATLADAATDFNGFAGGPVANYEFFIISDLAEAANVAFGNTTNGFTVTFRPQGAARTIDFNQITDNAGPSGHWVFGSSTLGSYTMFKTDNIIIDGSLTPGGTTRDLTLRNTAATSIPNAYIIRIVGDCDGCQVKNTIIQNRTTAGTSAYGVFFTSRTPTDLVPDNGLVRNCQITVNSGNAAQGIATSNSGTITAGLAQTGMVFEDNVITARTRGIFLNQSSGVTIRRNTISIAQTNVGSWSQGIYYLSDNSATGWTANIYDNVFTNLTSAATAGANGITGIAIDTGSSAGTARTINIYNNIITGFSLTGVTTADLRYSGIRIASSNANILAEHNTVIMPNFATVNNTTIGYTGAIISTAAVGAGLTVTFRNNAIQYAEDGGAALQRNSGGTFTSSGNNIFVSGTANTGRLATTNYATLGDWQGQGHDAAVTGGQAIDLTATTPSAISASTGKWSGSAKPAGVFSCASSTILTDIDGDARTSGLAYPGADEFAAFPLPVELSGFDLM